MRSKNAPNLVFDKVEHDSLSDLAVQQIEDMILSGVLREGDLLPGERELSAQLGISRPKVREALHHLADRELLRIVTNGGIYVARLGGEVMSPALVDLYSRNGSALMDNLEYRREQEAFAARLAAQRATDRDRAELTGIIEAMHTADDAETASELDLQFHTVLVFASHNRTLTHMMTALYNLNRSSVFYNRDELLGLGTSSQHLFQQHADIADAICARQPEQAEAAAKAHIDYVAELVEASFAQRRREKMSAKRYTRVG